MQIGDRLVTRGSAPPDRMANKNVVYEARDAIVSIGYSGRASLGGCTTDRWIAQQLWGEELPDGFGQIYRSPARSVNLGQAIEQLRSGCADEFRKLPRGTHTLQQLVLVGWRWNRRRSRPVVVTISNNLSSPNEFDIERPPRYWYYSGPNSTPAVVAGQPSSSALPFMLATIPDRNPLMRGQIDRMITLLSGSLRNPELAATLLVKAIRIAAAESPLVGGDCMGVFIPPPESSQVFVRYMPQSPAAAEIRAGQRSAVLPCAYSPYVISPRAAVAPSVLVGGGCRVHTGRFDVNLEAPPVPLNPLGLRMAWYSQKRPSY